MAEILKGSAYERWEVPAMDEARAAETLLPDIEDVDEEELLNLPTLGEIEAIQQQAHDEGFAEGHALGLKAAEIEAKSTLDEALAKLEEQRVELQEKHQQQQQEMAAEQALIVEQSTYLAELLEGLTHPLEELDETVEEQLLHLTISVARQLVRRELKTDPGEIVAIIREALAMLPVGKREIQIYLNAEDMQIVKSSFSLADDDQRTWQLLEDPTISRGGCRLVSNDSQIDASVEKRLTAVATKLLGGERGHEQA
ncbi:MAG: flagellar assembly protein FliH [Gammaproteobacteria bacterium]|nr:flagellar assembly protein FliH [Gammaproteobacteria bacterium]